MGSVASAAPDEDTVARASMAVARFLATEAGPVAATGTDDGFDRHWRDVRTHTPRDPVRWKCQAVGRYHPTGERPPRHGTI